MNKSILYSSLLFSIVIQVLTGVLDIYALTIHVPSELHIIKQLLVLELVVQVVEGSFYIWLFRNFNSISNITPNRYIDWFITTPTMLTTLIIYLIYLNNKDSGTNHKLDFFELFYANFGMIMTILSLNWLMLLFGYLGEHKVLPIITSVFLGFIPFVIYYYLIFTNFVSMDNLGWQIFVYFVGFWALYGVAAFLPYYVKNTMFNILDLFSKNFFGLFLVYVIYVNKGMLSGEPMVFHNQRS
jgi:bacteriorhodopsin